MSYPSLPFPPAQDSRLSSANQLYAQGKVLLEKRDFGVALDNLYNALSIYEELEHSAYMSATLTTIGMLFALKEVHGAAIQFYYRAQGINMRIQDTRAAAKVLNNLGYSYYKMGNFLEAEKIYEKALDIFYSLRDAKSIETVRYNLTCLYEIQDS